MNLLGSGIIFTRGAGMSALEQALREGWQPPAETTGKRLVYQVDVSRSPDKALLKKIRRSDKLSEMSVLAAAEAFRESGIEDIAKKKVGIILATAFGAHVTTFSFIDDILDYGDANASPTIFSNSVHNAAASYIATTFGIKGPTLTVTQFRFSFFGALQLAEAWLALDRCEYVLVGAVDQYGDVLAYASERKLLPAPDGKIRPFSFHPTSHVPGEGAVFFLFGREETGRMLCRVETGSADDHIRPDLNIIAADGMMPDESVYLGSLDSGVPTAGYAPLFGTIMNSSAFNMAAGALMLGNQHLYASPVDENPKGIQLLTTTGSSRVGSVRCIDYDCTGEKKTIYLKKTGH